MKARLARTGLLLAALGLGVPIPGAAQEPQNERLVTADGVRLDFPPDGVWRRRARQVAAQRVLLRSRGNWTLLNAPAASGVAGAGPAVGGTLFAPAILIAFKDTDTDTTAVIPLPRRAEYDSIFFTSQAWRGRPYTQRTLYEEMSNGLLTIGGQVYGWVKGAQLRSYYLDACGASANALDCATGRFRMYQLFLDALRALDTTGVDFGQYDNDGPDGIPNSGDDDGIVDVVQFVQPVVGGECRGRGIWAHKSSLSYLGSLYSTNDAAHNGGTIKIGPYHIVGGVGGEPCRDSTQIMGIGTASHELGHGLGLPDLYDVSNNTQGEGEWGLMGSANYTSLLSPGQMDAWCKDQLGWVVERPLTATGAYSLGGVVSTDSIFLIRPRGGNPRGEYFLLENKQPEGSDTYNMTVGSPSQGPKQGGLLVWHIDSLKLATSGFAVSNTVNSGIPHGVELVQADNLGQLDKSPSGGGNRGDAGDPYPGSHDNHTLSKTSAPAAAMNADGSFAGFALSNVGVGGGRASFDLALATVIRPNDTLGVITVNGARFHRFYDVLRPSGADTVGVPSPQDTPDGRARYVFNAWSDGGAQTHAIPAGSVSDSLVALLDAQYLLKVSQAGTGAIAASPSADLSGGAFFPAGSLVTLIATAGPDSVFDGWAGDTVSSRDTLVLTMRRPFTLSATFAPLLKVVAATPPTAIMGAAYDYHLPVQGGTGLYQWNLTAGALPAGVTVYTDGRLAGIPAETGAFDLTIRVASGSQSVTFSLHLLVEAPVVPLDAAVHQLLQLDATLTADQVRYLDLLGNRNSRLDLGDFLAWLKATGVKPSPQVMAGVLAGTALRTPPSKPRERAP
jgi:M6 family metalloprotease-like protein